MRLWIESALVQIMACRLFGAKSLSKPILCYCQTLRYKPKWNINQDTKLFIHKNAFVISSVNWRPFCPEWDDLARSLYWHHGVYCRLIHHLNLWCLIVNWAVMNKHIHVHVIWLVVYYTKHPKFDLFNKFWLIYIFILLQWSFCRGIQ